MKLNMRLLVLLLAGNAQVFAAIKDIPSMKPAEIVKLDYAALSQAEQNSLWFTAMFTGLQANRTAARQVISKKFPAVKWQDIEGIALSAKQSNKIDDGVARAQATVGIIRMPVVQTYFTQKQVEHINAQVKALDAIDKQIKQLLPKAPAQDYNALTQLVGQEPSFDQVMNLLRTKKEDLEVMLNVLHSDERKLNEIVLQLQKLVPQLKYFDPNYYMFMGSSPKMSSYDDFKDTIMHVRQFHGVQDALVVAQEIKNRLITDLAQLQKLKAQADIIAADLPQEKATLLLRLAEQLDAKALKAKEYDHAYKDYKQGSFKQRAHQLVQQEDSEADTVHQIELLIGNFQETLQLLTQLEQKRHEYGIRVAAIERSMAALKDDAIPLVYFDELLKQQGVHEATKALREYEKRLDM